MLVAPRFLHLLTCLAAAASSDNVYPRSFQDAWDENTRKHQLPPAFEDRFRHEDDSHRHEVSDAKRQWPRFYDTGRPEVAAVAAPSQLEPFSVFRSILKRANGFQELLRDDSSSLLGDNIALSGQAIREVFNNGTGKVRMADMSRIRVHPGDLVQRKRRVGLRRFTRKLFLKPTTKTRRTTVTTTSTTTTAAPTTAFSLAFFPSRRRKLFVRFRKLDKDILFKKLVTKGVLHANVVEAPTRNKQRRYDSAGRVESPRRTTSRRSIVEMAYALPDLPYRPRRSHLSLSDGFLKKRFGTFKDLEVHLVSGGSAVDFEVPDVEVVHKHAAVYRTPMDNTSLELYCMAGYKTAASVTWRVNGRSPEEFVSTETAFSKRDAGLKVIISRLRLQRLEVLPTTTGNYSFECVANVDDSDARATTEIAGTFNNSCIDSSDCDARNALCTFGKCECKDFLPVPLNSRHTTCRSFGYIGWPCHYDEQCSYAVQNSVCSSKGRCACLQDYRRNKDNQTCVPRSGLGAECSEPRDCEAARAVCRGGHCRCPEGKSPREGSCFDLPAAPLLERMKDKMFRVANLTVSSSNENATLPTARTVLPFRKAAVSSARSLGDSAMAMEIVFSLVATVASRISL